MAETGRLLDALRFLTIIPVPPARSAIGPDWLARSIKYFPAIGIGIGCASAAVLLLARQFCSPPIAALLAVAAGIIVSGALHEDGLADTADAFGGGWTKDRRLAIMKDSRIGAYGALALGLGVALRVAALADLAPWTAALALIAAHAIARATPMMVMNAMAYAGDTATMKAGFADTPVRAGEFAFALSTAAIAAAPLALQSTAPVLAGLLIGATQAIVVALWSRRLIGGYTGDVLGAVEQLFEIGFLIGVTATLR